MTEKPNNSIFLIIFFACSLFLVSKVISRRAELTDKSRAKRLCSTPKILTLSSAHNLEIDPNCPGLSAIAIDKVIICPLRTKSLISIDESTLESILPPQRKIPTFLFLNLSLFSKIAARPAAPAPSETTLSFNKNIETASSIEFSETFKTSFTFSLIVDRGILPIFETAIPSAKVEPPQTKLVLL